MSKPFLRVAKVGGSLFDFEGLPTALRTWIDREPGINILIGGGGALADFIRSADARFQLGEKKSHDLCLKAMSVSAELLAVLLPEAPLLRDVESLREHITTSGSRIAILDPALALAANDMRRALPNTWEVTSDSIAACLAETLAADELVLFKSRDLPPKLDRVQASTAGLVDAHFPDAAARVSAIRWVRLRRQPVTERPL